MTKKLVFALFFFIGMATAAEAVTWVACTPTQIGPYGDVVRIQVTNCNVDPSGGKNGWMTLLPENIDATNQMLATILAAMMMKSPIAVAFDNEEKDDQGYNVVLALILNSSKQGARTPVEEGTE